MSIGGLAFMGDLHASDTIYERHPRMRGDSRCSLLQITEFCRRKGCPLVLLGDNVDRRLTTPNVLKWFLAALRGVQVGFIQGQHCRHDMPWLMVESHVDGQRVHLHKQTADLGGFRLYGFDHSPRTRVQEQLVEVPVGTELLCLHQMGQQVMGLEQSWDIDFNQLPSTLLATFLGDWHGMPQDGVTDGRAWYYTGSSCMRSISEPVNKSFIYVTRNSDGTLNVARQPLKTRPYLFSEARYDAELDTWAASIVADAAAARDKAQAAGLPDEVAIPFVVLRYTLGIPQAYDRIMTALGPALRANELFFHAVGMRASNGDVMTDEAEFGTRCSWQDVVDAEIDKTVSPELHGLVSELATAPDPRATIRGWKQRRGIVDDPLTR